MSTPIAPSILTLTPISTLTPTKSTDTLHLIRCVIGQETYGLDMSWVRSIQRIDNLLIDEASQIDARGFRGWLPYNDGDIPVFSMAQQLRRPSLSEVDEGQQRIIVLPSPTPFAKSQRIEGQPWGLLVDGVSRVVEVAGDDFYPLPRIAIDPLTNYFEGVIKLADSLILFLSPEWLHPDAPVASDYPLSEEPQTRNGTATHLRPHRASGKNQNHTSANGTTAKLTKAKTGHLLVFSLAHSTANEQPFSFGLSITQVPEVLRTLPLTPVPTAPPYVLGLINWRDQPVPVIDLGARLGLTAPMGVSLSEYTHLMLARGVGQNTFVAFPIQPDVQVLTLPVAHQPSPRASEFDPYLVHAVADLQDKTLVIPNITNILEP